MAVRGGLTRFARPAGSPLTAFTVCPTGCRQLSTPGRGFSSPGVCNTRKKSPYFRTSSSLNMAVRGGLTRFARPAGSPLTAFTVCPTGCRQLSNPGRGFSSPRCVQYTKKKPVLSYELFFKYGGEGGIDSLRSPCGQPAHCVHGLSNWLSPVVEPRSGLLIPPVCAIYEKKARTFVRALL
ncbi:ybl54 [Escherichia coli]|nr:ybl54 [Escherichia coli]